MKLNWTVLCSSLQPAKNQDKRQYEKLAMQLKYVRAELQATAGGGGPRHDGKPGNRVCEKVSFRKQKSSGAIYGVRAEEYAVCYG